MALRGALQRGLATAWRPGRRPGPCQHLGVRTLLPLSRSAGLVFAVLLMAGCADQPDTATTGSAATSGSSAATSGSSPAAPGSSAASAPATEEGAGSTPFPADTAADTAAPVDPSGLTLTAVRAAQHEGYDRVVFEFTGSGTPGWSVEYVDAPSSQGSGAEVAVPGSSFLQVTAQGTSYPYESGATELPPGPVPVSGTGVVQGVVYDATFEGTSVAWIGTSDRTPFRVYALTGPSRLVVEVADAG